MSKKDEYILGKFDNSTVTLHVSDKGFSVWEQKPDEPKKWFIDASTFNESKTIKIDLNKFTQKNLSLEFNPLAEVFEFKFKTN